jgi:hypothetical protein
MKAVLFRLAELRWAPVVRSPAEHWSTSPLVVVHEVGDVCGWGVSPRTPVDAHLAPPESPRTRGSCDATARQCEWLPLRQMVGRLPFAAFKSPSDTQPWLIAVHRVVCVCSKSPLGHSLALVFLQVRSPRFFLSGPLGYSRYSRGS